MYVSPKYHLELHWKSVEYPQEDMSILKGAYFTGTVLKDAARINEKDQLILDMTNQHLVFIPDYYQGVLKWSGVEYRQDKVFLKEASIKGKYVNSVETLQNDDYILIDCRKHDAKTHAFHLVYFAEIRKKSKEKKF